MFSFATHVFTSLLLAFIITTTLILLLIWGMKLLFSHHALRIDIGVVLGLGLLTPILFVQSFLCCGASYAKKYLGTVEASIQTAINIEGSERHLNSKEIEVAKATIINEYPLLKRYVKDIDELDFKDGLTNVVSPVYSIINKYMWRRILWMVGALIVIGGILCYRADKEQQRAAYLRNRLMNL